jgi:hypothetical protein
LKKAQKNTEIRKEKKKGKTKSENYLQKMGASTDQAQN